MKSVIYGLVAAVVALSLAVAFQFRSLERQRAASRVDTCKSISRLDNNLIGLIRTGEKATAKFAYYKEHPVDLARVIEQDTQAIRKLRPPTYC